MGGRVEGRTKKKSIKANVTSKFSSKRKASRMGKKVKKGQMGPNTEFITRSTALRKLQITLKDFRRLCILKGVYPRVPSKGLKGNDKVYYDIKDISYIMHEPLLQKFRDFKSFMKKIRRAAGRNQHLEARRKDAQKPQISLDHLVKERYPRFIDALRDLDDALCMVHLFAALPSSGRITSERTATCSRLVRHWQYYVSKSRSLHKVFVSVKGVYFQAELMGEPITWVVPHQFTQYVPKEVDLRVMLTFLEFYEVFLQFVLFKLYSIRNWQYPPAVDAKLDAAGCFLLAMKTKSTAGTASGAEAIAADTNTTTAAIVKPGAGSEKLATLPKLLKKLKDKETAAEDEEEDEEEEEGEQYGQLADPLRDALNRYSDTDAVTTTAAAAEEDDDNSIGELEQQTFDLSGDPRQRLFSKLVFFVNREVPLEWMQLCVTALGGRIGWEESSSSADATTAEASSSPYKIDDPRITHHIIDRPQLAVAAAASREYVQPQWVFDSINAQVLLPVHAYRPGAKLPPHLSPFVDNAKEGYVPQYSEEIKKMQQQMQQQAGGVGTVAVPAIENRSTTAEGSEVEDEGADSNVDSDDSEEEEEVVVPTVKRKFSSKNAAAVAATAVENTSKKSRSAASEPVTTAPVSKKVSAKKAEQQQNDIEDDKSAAEEAAAAVGKSKKGAQQKGPKGVIYKPPTAAISEEDEAAGLSKIMMTKKSKRLYGRMQHGIEQKQAAVQTLQNKREQIEQTQQQASTKQHGTRTKAKQPKSK